jgi:hypothetical protein
MKFDGSIVDDGIWPTIDFKIKGETNFFRGDLKGETYCDTKGIQS